MRSIDSCSQCGPIIPIILVRQLQGQLHCILPTGNCSSSAIRPNLSVLLHVPFADCIRRYCSFPLCHNNNTIKSALFSAWKVRGKLQLYSRLKKMYFPLDEDPLCILMLNAKVNSFTCIAFYSILKEQKKALHFKRVQLPLDWFGTSTWPPFDCFGITIWRMWRHVKSLYYYRKLW